jgi:F1F0 ATPase subunit 2
MEVLPLLMAFMAGLALGGWYFGGLWMTVRRLTKASAPALLALGSFWLRLAVSMMGFYVVMNGQWERLLVCFVGFLGMRSILIHHWRPARQSVAAASARGTQR